jgi:hypothetical protein
MDAPSARGWQTATFLVDHGIMPQSNSHIRRAAWSNVLVMGTSRRDDS